MRQLLLFPLLFFLLTLAQSQDIPTIEHIDTMPFTQENFDEINVQPWALMGDRRFEQTLPIFKAIWVRGEKEYAAKQDSISYLFLNFGKATYGQWLTKLGRYDEGIPIFEEALYDTENYFGPMFRISFFYVGLSLAYEEIGDIQRAIWAQNQAARITNIHVLPGRYSGYSYVGYKLGRLAQLYADCGQYQKAIKLLEEAARIYQISGSKWSELGTICLKGNISAEAGNFALARKYLDQGHRFNNSHSIHGGGLMLYNSKAKIEVAAGNLERAVDYYQAADFLAETVVYFGHELSGNEIMLFTMLRLDYANCLFQMGEVSKSKEVINKIKILRANLKTEQNTVEAINIRILKAQIAAAEHDLLSAEEELEGVIGGLTNQRVVDWLQPEIDSVLMASSPTLAKVFRISAEIQVAAGIYPLAPILANCNAGKAVLRKIQLSYAPDVTMDQLLRDNQSLYDISVEKAYAEATSLGNPESIEAYFLAIEEARDQQLLASIDTREEVAYGLPEDLRTAEAKARQRLRSYERLLNLEQGKQPRNDALILEYGGHLHSARLMIDSIADVIREAFPEYYELKFRDRPLVLRDVKDILGKKEAMICYYVTPQKTYGLLITREEAIPFSADLPEDRIHTFNKTLLQTSAAPTTEWQQQSLALYEQLLGPVRERNLNRLIVVPDKALNFLAWPALLTAAGPPNADWRSLPYLIRSANLRQEASAGVFVRQRDSRSTAGAYSYAGFAPAYDGEAYSMRSDSGISEYELYFPELTRQQPGGLVYNGDEVKYATSLFVNPVAEVGSGATEAFFKEIAGNASILHVASHGITSASDPAASHLLFSKSQEGDMDDGLLYAWEIYGMKIPADLTVLSACQTGTGAIRSGIGVLSLARAFRYAGSKDVVMSLWSVNDRSTYQVMRTFFTGVKDEQDKASALQGAMIDHLNTEKNDEFTHPYYWAGFSLVGPGEVLDTGERSMVWLWGGLLAFFSLVFFWWRRQRW